jgi:hypothetical protein
MPTLSASDYTNYLKFKAASQTAIRPSIQTRDNVTLSQSVLNAMTLTSEAAFRVVPYNSTSTVLGTTVSAVSMTTVSAARTNLLTGATADGTKITYTSSQAHGLANGDSITITDFTGTLSPSPNRTGVVTVESATTFTIPAVATPSGTAEGPGRIVGRVYYTTTVANGLLVNDVISITDITTFTASNATVIAVPTATTFVISSTTHGGSVSGQTGTITGLVYYTTAAAHGLSPVLGNNTTLVVSGLTTTPAFNTGSLTSLYRVPSATVFILQSGVVGTAITGQSGVLTLTVITNPNNTLTGLNYVRPRAPERTNNPKNLSTVSWSSGSSITSTTSSKTQQPGGLPTAFRSSQSTYTRLPQNAGWS